MSSYQPHYQKSHALLIGIDAYTAFPPLMTAIKGVRDLEQVLRDELGFENIITLKNAQASQRMIRRKLIDPFSRQEQVGPDDRVLVYFAGHGLTVDTAVGEIGYLVPADGDPHYEDTLIAMDELTRIAAERIYAKHVLFLLDACFSGYATTRMSEGVRRQLEDYLTLPTRQVITAGTRNQAVSDCWGPGGHSLFTGFLLQGLKGNALTPGGVLRAFHLAGYLQDQVAQHSKSKQTPQYASLLGSEGGDFILSVRDVAQLPQWLIAAAESSDPTQRLVAVGQLRTFVHSEREAEEALARLEVLASDEDSLVSSSAQTVLRELMPEPEIAPVERVEPVVAPPEQPEPEPQPTQQELEQPASLSDQPVGARRALPIPWIWIGGISALIVVGIIGLIILLRNIGSDSQLAEESIQTEVMVAEEEIAEPTPTEHPTAEPTPHPALVLAETGISNNGDWEPYIQEFARVPMALVPAGCFMMGSEDGESNEQPVHEVCFDEPFWIDVYEVTNEQYGSYGEWSDKSHPRETIDWFDAVFHCETREARLPTEAEWEYAARGPDALIYPWGDDFVSDNVVYSVYSGSHTWNVGSKLDGVSWVGAYDLSGNISEWVNDWYATDYYASSPESNPQGPESGQYRVRRGGSWDKDSYLVRAADRSRSSPIIESSLTGFRCARSYQP